MKIQWPWTVVIAALLVLCGWNIYQNRRLHRAVTYLTGGKGLDTQSHPFKEAVLAARDVALRQAGRFLKWPASLEVMGEDVVDSEGRYRGYRLVLAFSELSCNSCREESVK